MKSLQPIVWIMVAASWLVLGAPHVQADGAHPATTTSGGKFEVGAKIGPNLTTYGGEHADGEIVESTSKLGFTAGGHVSMRVHPLLRVGSDMALATRGTRIVIDGEDVGMDDLKYWKISGFLQVLLPVSGRIRPYGLAGAELGILLSATEKSNQGNSTDIKHKFTSTDVCLLLGVGTHVEITSRGAVILEAQYALGLRDIFHEEMPPDVELKNRAISVVLGYQHRFGGGSSH